MRILWVVYGSLDRLSGGNLYDRLVVDHLRARGAQVEVLGLPQPPYPLGPLQALPSRLRREEGLEAIVVDELTHPSLFAWARARCSGVRRPRGRPRLVTLVHHLRSCEPPPVAWRALARAWERRLLTASDAVIANSRATAAAVRELAGDLPVAICPPGCDRLAAPAPTAAGGGTAAGEETSSGPVRLLATGNLIHRKGYDLLLRVLAGMTDLPWELRISGRSVDRLFAGRLRSLVRRGGLGGRVRFLGEVDTELLAGEYRRAQVFVFPSRYEGYGISLAEAAFAGLPFVAFAVGAVAEAVRGGGLLAAPGDLAGFGAHLRRLIAEPAFRQEQAVLSREVARGLPRWQDTGRAFQAALEAACG